MRTIEKKLQKKFENFQPKTSFENFLCRSSILKILFPWGPMATKTKKFVKNPRNTLFQNSKNVQALAQGNQQIQFERIHAIDSEIIDAKGGRTDDGRTMDDRRRTADAFLLHELC